MKTQHTFQPMEFAQYFNNHGVHQAVTVLEVDNDEAHQEQLAKIHYYTGIEMSDVVVKWVPVSQLIPMIGAAKHVDPIDDPRDLADGIRWKSPNEHS